jgi:hypothetical protein
MTLYSSITIPGPAGSLEVCVEEANQAGALAADDYCAVVCHPHPLYGGTMDSQVVISVASVYRDLGIPVARFNFRGVGGSEGSHDNGSGEVEDLRAVAEYLLDRTSGRRLLIAGYSFGSVVAAASDASLEASHLMLIAPPTESYTFAPEGYFSCPAIVVLGEIDELARPQSASKWASQLSSKTTIITVAGADHFFAGQLATLNNLLEPALLNNLI